MNPAAASALYDAASTRALERFALADSALVGSELMERAGAAVFAVLRRYWPAARRIAVVCGPGNNGGDGFVIARLAAAAGLDARVHLLAEPARLRGDAAAAYAALLAAGLAPVMGACDLGDAEVVVDALLGIGLDRDVGGQQAQAIERINAAALPVLSVDVPSGIDATSGRCWGMAVRATVTVSLVTLKQGLVTGAGPDYAGALEVDYLGLPASAYAAVPPTAQAIAYADLCHVLVPRRRTAHKGDHGHVLVIGGAPGCGGAARMAAEAAARCGAGLVSLATHPAHAASITALCPEIMCHGVSSAAELAPLLARATVIAIGPGLGQSAWATAVWSDARDSRLPQVVDADALNLLARAADVREDRVLTPHPGEAARLLGAAAAPVRNDRFAAANALRRRYGGVVLLKGAGTIIASAGQVPQVVRDGNPGMATGGMGDVLTGVIAALIAQGFALPQAAALGACVHAHAGDVAAALGERGLLATDLLPFLRAAVNP